MAEILIKHLVKRFGKVEAVKDVSLQVADGEFLVLLGPSGCGKSTILRVVAGLEDADSGEIDVGGRLANFVDPVERNVAMVFQNYALYPHMTVQRTSASRSRWRRSRRARSSPRVGVPRAVLGLEEMLHRLPEQLSGGQRQRVALGARDRARAARVPDGRAAVESRRAAPAADAPELIQLHQQLGTTTIYVTHDQVEAMTMADRIVVMRDGSPAGRHAAGGLPSPANSSSRPSSARPPMNLIDGALVARTAAGASAARRSTSTRARTC